MPWSRTHSRSSPRRTALPSAIGVSAGEYFTALDASCSHAWVTRCGSRDASTSARSSSSHRRGARPRAFSRVSSVRRPMSVAQGCTKSLRSALARVSRSSTRRPIRSSSSRARARVARTSSASVGVHQLEVAADDGDGGAQFVADVVEQLTLTVENPLQPVEHGVHGTGQGRQVVVAVHRYAPAQVVLGDVLGGGAQQPDRLQQASDQQPDQEPDRGQRSERDQGIGAVGGAQQIVLGAHVEDLHQRAVLAREVHRNDGVEVVVAIGWSAGCG